MTIPGHDPRFIEYNSSNSKTSYDKYIDQIDDNVFKDSLEGHAPDELGEGDALDIHDDSYHPPQLSKVHPDDELETSIRELLKDTKMANASDVSVIVKDSNVKLSGSVKSQADRDYIISIVKWVHGVGEIKSELTVKLNQGILPTDIGRNPG